MFRIHGYVRGDVVPTLEAGFAHIDPAHRVEAHHLWAEVIDSDAPLAWYYTLIDASGRHRRVIAIAEPLKDGNTVIGVTGFLVDITTSVHEDTHRTATEAVSRSAQTRAVIEQAKGVLMVTYGINADTAFAHLSRYSQTANRKVSLLAEDIMGATPDVRRILTRSICSPPILIP